MADCVFCAIATGAPAHVLHQDERVIAILDRAPLIAGHALVLPRAHVVTLDDLAPDLVAPLFTVVQRISRAFPVALAADGSFTAINTRVSQTVPHLHVHVVPRRKGDGLFRAGMVWVRRPYRDGEAGAIAEKLRAALRSV
ncbi:MAG: HIT family protein [Candidatus Limnocylindria bacterium]